MSEEVLRIGEFARRVGVSTAVLRAWERRYGLLQPVRSQGGFRLYTDEDAERVGRMCSGIERGLSAAEAARAALASERPVEGLLQNASERLVSGIRCYDEDTVQAILDENLEAFGVESVLRELILPTLRRLGLEWEQRQLAVSQEHFASNLIRARLLSLARLWGRGGGPLALLACVPGEQHDISLLAFGLILRSHGWRVVFLGANTPIATILEAAETTRPSVAVLVSFDQALVAEESAALRRLAGRVPLMLSGPGADEDLCRRLGIERLGDDLIAAAHETARSVVA